MIERLTDINSSNWVDRGQEPEPELHRVLEYHLGRDTSMPPSRIREHVVAIRGMVEGDSAEVQVAGYLALVEKEAGKSVEPSTRRTVAIALWHIAKCAAIRDRARRLMTVGTRPEPLK